MEALNYDKIRRACWSENVFIETSDKTATLTLEDFKEDALCAGYRFKVALGRNCNIRFRCCRPADDYYDDSRLKDYIR